MSSTVPKHVQPNPLHPRIENRRSKIEPESDSLSLRAYYFRMWPPSDAISLWFEVLEEPFLNLFKDGN